MADDARDPANLGPHPEGLLFVLDLQNLGAARAQCLTHKTAGLVQNPIEIV